MADYEEGWSLTYETLRRLCVDHSDHESERAVAAKVAIIGRTYATQIERKVKSDGSQGSSLQKVTELLYEHRTDIDQWIASVPNGEDLILTDTVIPKCINAHGHLVELLEGITYDRQSPRSFASKYLHFHRPIMPIYDSVASQALSRLIRWQAAFDYTNFEKPEDEIYRQFVMHLRQLAGLASGANVRPVARDLDCYLLGEGERLCLERARSD